MTKQIVIKGEGAVPVEFRVYHNKREVVMKNGVIVKDNENKAVHKWVPDPSTFVTLTLYRDPTKGETVGHCIDRLKDMLVNSQARWQILTAIETDEERTARRKKDGIEVVTPITNERPNEVAVDQRSNYDPLDGDGEDAVHPLSAAANDLPMKNSDIEGEHDNGRIHTKKKAKPARSLVAA